MRYVPAKYFQKLSQQERIQIEEERKKREQEERFQHYLRTRNNTVHSPAPMKPITDLKGIYVNQDIWVIAAAASMDYVDPTFFQNKITICVNKTYRKFPCKWVVGRELEQEHYDEVHSKLITCKQRYGNTREFYNKYNGKHPYYVWEHGDVEKGKVDLSILNTDEIVGSRSTITSAMHVAAYMGAKNIILCGVDGGTLDGKLTYDTYYSDDEFGGHGYEGYREFVQEILDQTLMVAEGLRSTYLCNIYSLNPFLNFSFENHKFDPA